MKGRDAEFLQPRKLVQDGGCRGDRIAAEEQRQSGKLRARDKAQRNRFSARHGAVEAGRCKRGIDVILLHRAADLGGLGKGMASVQRGDIGCRGGWTDRKRARMKHSTSYETRVKH